MKSLFDSFIEINQEQASLTLLKGHHNKLPIIIEQQYEENKNDGDIKTFRKVFLIEFKKKSLNMVKVGGKSAHDLSIPATFDILTCVEGEINILTSQFLELAGSKLSIKDVYPGNFSWGVTYIISALKINEFFENLRHQKYKYKSINYTKEVDGDDITNNVTWAIRSIKDFFGYDVPIEKDPALFEDFLLPNFGMSSSVGNEQQLFRQVAKKPREAKNYIDDQLVIQDIIANNIEGIKDRLRQGLVLASAIIKHDTTDHIKDGLARHLFWFKPNVFINFDGLSVLMISLIFRRNEIAKELLLHGADVNYIFDGDKFTAMDIALVTHNDDLTRVLYDLDAAHIMVAREIKENFQLKYLLKDKLYQLLRKEFNLEEDVEKNDFTLKNNI